MDQYGEQGQKSWTFICNTIVAIKFCIAASRPFAICTLLTYAYNNLLKSINMTEVYFVLEHQHFCHIARSLTRYSISETSLCIMSLVAHAALNNSNKMYQMRIIMSYL